MSAAEESMGGPVAWSAAFATEEGRGLLRDAALAGPASGREALDAEGRSRLLAGLVDPAGVRAALDGAGHVDRRRRGLAGGGTGHAGRRVGLFRGGGGGSVP